MGDYIPRYVYMMKYMRKLQRKVDKTLKDKIPIWGIPSDAALFTDTRYISTDKLPSIKHEKCWKEK